MEDIDLGLAAHSNDAYFKDVFSDPRRAGAFFQEHLPAAVAARMDWASLQLMPGSFVKQSLQQAHSDLLFSIQMEGTPCRLYLLFEHQTTVDALMPLRLLSYMVEILDAHAQTDGRPLPPVVPLVLHQGPDRWTVSPCFEDLFELPPSLAEILMPYLPKFRHALLDLSQFDPASQEMDEQNRVVLQLMKMVRHKRLLEFFAWLAGQILPPDELLRKSLLYAFHADTKLDVELIFHTLGSNQAKLKEEIMSTATLLRAEGKAEGKAEGRAEGEIQGKLKFLQELMGLPVSSNEELAGLGLAELERRFKALQRQFERR